MRRRLSLTRLAPGLAAAGLALTLAGCIGGGPQITSISPGRGASGVASDVPVRITFGGPVDRPSVDSRLHLYPMRNGKPLKGHAVKGHIDWRSERTALFVHPPLRPNTYYQVVLKAGYQDTSGSTNDITHSWVFKTESPPTLTGSSPGPQDTGVDPASDLVLNFSQPMNQKDLTKALALEPDLQLRLVQGQTPTQFVVAPDGLFAPNTHYRLTISTAARDRHGNHLPKAATIPFTTGALASLASFVSVAAGPPGDATGTGVWIVDAAGIPRRILKEHVQGFSWWPDGIHLTLRTGPRSWAEATAGSAPHALPFEATWATPLGSGRGYLYLDGGQLERLRPDGTTVTLAQGVQEAALSPDGKRVAFTVASQSSTEIRGLDLAIQTQYLIQVESGSVTGPSWSPDGTRLAYLHSANGSSGEIKVRTLVGGDQVTTVVRGPVGIPAWMPDSRRVLFPALVDVGGAALSKVVVASVLAPPGDLSRAAALPSGSLDITAASPSPEGHQIAFLAPIGGRVEAFSMNADGTGVEQLTGAGPWFPYSCRALAWSLP